MLSEWINKRYLDPRSTSKLRIQFSKAYPFPHHALKDFFREDRLAKIYQALQTLEYLPKESDLFKFSQTGDFATIKNSVLREFYQFFSSDEFNEYIYKITKIKIKHNKIDMSSFIYRNTDHLLPHDDKVENRSIAYVLNLSKGFTKSDGGTLDFYDYNNKTKLPNKIVKSFVPTYNTLFLFKALSNSFHQVSEQLTDNKRVTITGWFYR